MSFSEGDRVQVDLEEPEDFDKKYDGAVGEVIAVHRDDLGELTGAPAYGRLYLVAFDDDDLLDMSFRESELTSV